MVGCLVRLTEAHSALRLLLPRAWRKRLHTMRAQNNTAVIWDSFHMNRRKVKEKCIDSRCVSIQPNSFTQARASSAENPTLQSVFALIASSCTKGYPEANARSSSDHFSHVELDNDLRKFALFVP
jgi:hypothetical protein